MWKTCYVLSLFYFAYECFCRKFITNLFESRWENRRPSCVGKSQNNLTNILLTRWRRAVVNWIKEMSEEWKSKNVKSYDKYCNEEKWKTLTWERFAICMWNWRSIVGWNDKKHWPSDTFHFFGRTLERATHGRTSKSLFLTRNVK